MVLDLHAKGCMLMSLANCLRQDLPVFSYLGLGHPGHPLQSQVANELPKPALQQHQGLGGQPPLPWEALGAACNQRLRQKNEEWQDVQCHFYSFHRPRERVTVLLGHCCTVFPLNHCLRCRNCKLSLERNYILGQT